MSETKTRADYGDVVRIVKQLRERGLSQRAIENVLRFYGVET